MNINKNNYESWFLDYHEGTLSAEGVAELFLFLEKYPEFKNEFESFAQITLPSSEEVFSSKDSLKKNTITVENYNEYLIAELEGDLNLQEQVALKTFVNVHPELEKEKLLFSKTILQREVVAYPAKAELKKHVLVARKNNFPTLWLAAAAIILLLIGVYFIQSPEKPQVAQQQENNLPKTSNNNVVTKNNSRKTIDNVSEEKNVTASLDTHLLQLMDKSSLLPEEIKPDKEIASHVSKSKTHLRHRKKEKQIIIPENPNVNNNAELAMVSSPRLESSLIISPVEVAPEKVAAPFVSSPVISTKRSFNPLQLFDDVKTAAADKVNRVTGDEILYSSAKPNQFKDEKLPFKSRMIKLLAWTIKKISNDNVKLKTDFDFDGNLASYELSAGKFKVEKNF